MESSTAASNVKPRKDRRRRVIRAIPGEMDLCGFTRVEQDDQPIPLFRPKLDKDACGICRSISAACFLSSFKAGLEDGTFLGIPCERCRLSKKKCSIREQVFSTAPRQEIPSAPSSTALAGSLIPKDREEGSLGKNLVNKEASRSKLQKRKPSPKVTKGKKGQTQGSAGLSKGLDDTLGGSGDVQDNVDEEAAEHDAQGGSEGMLNEPSNIPLRSFVPPTQIPPQLPPNMTSDASIQRANSNHLDPSEKAEVVKDREKPGKYQTVRDETTELGCLGWTLERVPYIRSWVCDYIMYCPTSASTDQPSFRKPPDVIKTTEKRTTLRIPPCRRCECNRTNCYFAHNLTVKSGTGELASLPAGIVGVKRSRQDSFSSRLDHMPPQMFSRPFSIRKR